MVPLLSTLLLVLIAGIGARDQVLLAQLVDRNGQRLSLFTVAAGTGVLASLVAGLAAQAAAPEFDARLRLLVAGLAMAVAGVEAVLIAPPRPAREPTQSLGAAAIVFLAHQLTDSARLLVFAIALAGSTPLAVIGASFGGSAALAIGWAGSDGLRRHPRRLRIARVACGMLLLAGSAWTAATVQGETDRLWRLLIP